MLTSKLLYLENNWSVEQKWAETVKITAIQSLDAVNIKMQLVRRL